MAAMFVVEPKRDCPHVLSHDHLLQEDHWEISVDRNGATNATQTHTPTEAQQPVVDYDIPNEQCSACNDTSENWICLKCKAINCSRYVSGHSNAHFESTNHCLCLSFSDLTTWCNLCESYIVSPLLRPSHRALYFNKFNALSPSEVAANTTATTATTQATQATAADGTLSNINATPDSTFVNGAPTLVTLRQALEDVPHEKYKEGDEPLECIVCQETVLVDETVTTLNTCSHKFHRTCLLTWLLRTNECPTCRTKVLEAWSRSPLVAEQKQ